jgi:hypothetical protein
MESCAGGWISGARDGPGATPRNGGRLELRIVGFFGARHWDTPRISCLIHVTVIHCNTKHDIILEYLCFPGILTDLPPHGHFGSAMILCFNDAACIQHVSLMYHLSGPF